MLNRLLIITLILGLLVAVPVALLLSPFWYVFTGRFMVEQYFDLLESRVSKEHGWNTDSWF